METHRLIIREYTLDDFDALYEIMSDPETMQHYPAPFDEDKTRNWIVWNLDNYEKYGFGLWAVVLKETGKFIGDCGITIQNIDGEMLPEIGYHIHKKYWRMGYAKEAVQATRDWAFQNTQYDTIFSYMKYTNVASYSTAMANGMKKVKEYSDPKNIISYAYAITRKEWEAIKGEHIVKYSEPLKEAVFSFTDICFRELGKAFEPEGRHSFYNDIDQEFESFWCLLSNNKVIGTVGVKKIDDSTTELKALYLLKEFRRKGFGFKLLDKAVQFAKEHKYYRIVLDSMAGYADAIRLYERYGFKRTERYNDNQYADVFMEYKF